MIESFMLPGFRMGGARIGEPNGFLHLLYFSFTTLTTTSYGDITPTSDQARALAIIEDFVGVFFVGVLIERLAGRYRPRKR
jgi:hypothetical protein